MIVLGLDCSGDALTFGVTDEQRIIGSWNISARRRHSELLPGEILRHLAVLGLAMADIDGFAIISGPGSYTGLRVGAATVMGLATAAGAPTAALTTFEFLHRLYATDSRWLGCVIPCRGELCYWRSFPPGEEQGSDVEVLTPDEIIVLLDKPFRIVGPGAERIDKLGRSSSIDAEIISELPDDAGGLLAQWGAKKISTGESINWDDWQLDYGPTPGFRKWTRPTP